MVSVILQKTRLTAALMGGDYPLKYKQKLLWANHTLPCDDVSIYIIYIYIYVQGQKYMFLCNAVVFCRCMFNVELMHSAVHSGSYFALLWFWISSLPLLYSLFQLNIEAIMWPFAPHQLKTLCLFLSLRWRWAYPHSPNFVLVGI